ncbi:hypothetical protein L873DRAFT_947456 [Choiromyces venosus 120613-1]|uniref:Uncharacterized protein n=1 Tax=Choiromyces venosus 120613-1 TaxID=1336337 RepID=A0A3N4K3J3_9PEZI|nr:hypothetical protein L873DRAFT_947456 [Choiromyces venosus 120613-1]
MIHPYTSPTTVSQTCTISYRRADFLSSTMPLQPMNGGEVYPRYEDGGIVFHPLVPYSTTPPSRATILFLQYKYKHPQLKIPYTTFQKYSTIHKYNLPPLYSTVPPHSIQSTQIPNTFPYPQYLSTIRYNTVHLEKKTNKPPIPLPPTFIHIITLYRKTDSSALCLYPDHISSDHHRHTTSTIPQVTTNHTPIRSNPAFADLPISYRAMVMEYNSLVYCGINYHRPHKESAMQLDVSARNGLGTILESGGGG